MDLLDLKILRQLMAKGRTTWSDLAGQLDLSSPATADRVRRLEEAQVIQGYGAQVAPGAVGLSLTAFVAVTLERPHHRQGFLAWVEATAAIQECHHVTGDDDYLLKLRCPTTADLETILSHQLKALPGVARTRTQIVLSTPKETAALPLHWVEASLQKSAQKSEKS